MKRVLPTKRKESVLVVGKIAIVKAAASQNMKAFHLGSFLLICVELILEKMVHVAHQGLIIVPRDPDSSLF